MAEQGSQKQPRKYELAWEHWAWHRRFLKEVALMDDAMLDRIERVAIDYWVHSWNHCKEEMDG